MSHPGHDRLLKWRFNAQPILRGIALVGSVFSWRDQNRYMPQQPEEQTRRALCDATGSSSVSTVSTIYEEREREMFGCQIQLTCVQVIPNLKRVRGKAPCRSRARCAHVPVSWGDSLWPLALAPCGSRKQYSGRSGTRTSIGITTIIHCRRTPSIAVFSDSVAGKCCAPQCSSGVRL